MISWRWPRPIGGHGVDGLDAGLQRLLHRLALRRREGACSSSGAALGAGDLALAVDRAGRAGRRPGRGSRHRRGRRGSRRCGVPPGPPRCPAASPRMTQPISRMSRLSAMPSMPPSNSSSSLVMAECRPSTRAMPSPVSMTRPTSSRALPGLIGLDVRLERVADLVRADRQLSHRVPVLRCSAVEVRGHAVLIMR